MLSVGPMELLLLLLLLLWIAPSYAVARYAERRGQNFVLFLVLGLVTSFVVALVIALFLPPAKQPVGPWGVTTGPDAYADDQRTQLERLAELHARGVVNDAEFAEQKASILGSDPPE